MRLSVCVLIQYDWYPYTKREQLHVEKDTGKVREEMQKAQCAECWREAPSNQRPSNLQDNTQKVGKTKGRFSYRLQREHCSANTFIWDF